MNLVILDPRFSPREATYELFCLSPGFVVIPNRQNHDRIMYQVNDFLRKLQWKSSLPSRPPNQRFGFLKSERYPPTALVPTRILRQSNNVIESTRRILRRSDHSCFTASNLSDELKSEMLRLKDDSSIVIQPSDKGKRWVIMPTSLYEMEALRQLQDTDFYRRFDEDLVPQVSGQLTRLLNNLHQRKFITKKELEFLRPSSNFKERRFFLLPKLHKKKWWINGMPPGRPVVSDRGSLTRNVSNFVDFFLKPIAEHQDSYLKDSGHLIALLRTTSVSCDDILFTMDVESLYTNVPTREGIEVVSAFFLQYPDVSRPDLSLLSILRILLQTNDFVFRDSKWLQINGVAMGKSFGGSYANLFMANWEKSARRRCPLQPKFWRRYQDDILGIWSHGQESLVEFHRLLNSHHRKIRLTMSYGPSVNFLDLTISLVSDKIHYQLFSKDTDSHMILSPSSHHPGHTFRGVVFGEILRFASHSVSRSAFQRCFEEISKVWALQGYRRSLIREVKRSVLTLTNQLTIWETGSFPCGGPCLVCQHTRPVCSFQHPSKNVSYPIHYRITCETRNVVYIIKCMGCGKCYVGETSRQLRTRISEHLDNVSNNAQNLLARHFSTTCSANELTFIGVKIIPDLAKRRRFEASLISTIGTSHPNGLNVKAEFLADATNLILPYSDCARRIVTSARRYCGHRTVQASFYRHRNLRESLT